MAFPEHSKFVVIGTGVHDLRTAYHLALALNSRGLGIGDDILVLDKASVAAEASAIACGVVRKNAYPPA